MPTNTLDGRAARLDVYLHPGNTASLVLTFPSSLAGRTFTAGAGATDAGGTYGTSPSVNIVGAVLTVSFTEAQTTTLGTGALWWKLTETTAGGTQDLIVGKTVPNAKGTGHASTAGTVTLTSASLEVSIVGVDSGALYDYIDDAIADLVAGAPGALDTLNELAAALGDDANFAATVATSLGLKANVAADNITAATWRTALAVYSTAQVDTAVASEATLARNADNLTSGTVADARIAATIARDSEVAAAYQPLDADLTTIAGLTPTTDNFMVAAASAWASRTPAQAKTSLSLGNVDNTSDANKPVSTATQTALDLKAPKASPTFTGTIALSTIGAGDGATLSYRALNTDDNVWLVLGTGQAITNPANDVYVSTITPRAVNTAGAGARGVGLNIGQWVVTATDGASAITRTGEFVNIEHDFITFQQTGGTAIFNKVVSSRFRFAIPKTGVTIVDNKGIDFVVPNSGDVTGAVTNYIAVNIPALTGGGGTNFYGIRFNNEPAGGSIVSQGGDLVLKTLTNGQHIRLIPATGGGEVRLPASAPVVRIMPTGRGDKTFTTSASSPADILAITSVGPSGGWHGVIDLMVSNSAGTAFTVLRVDGAGTATGAVGFFGHAVSGQRTTTADASDLASVIALANALKADLQAFGLKA